MHRVEGGGAVERHSVVVVGARVSSARAEPDDSRELAGRGIQPLPAAGDVHDRALVLDRLPARRVVRGVGRDRRPVRRATIVTVQGEYADRHSQCDHDGAGHDGVPMPATRLGAGAGTGGEPVDVRGVFGARGERLGEPPFEVGHDSSSPSSARSAAIPRDTRARTEPS
jgi:hypothetical protein